jgi:serine/threonine-protein kinase
MTTPSDTTIGSIRIEQTLKSGGACALLLGRQPGLERLVAVRKLPGDLLERSAVIDRFRREARLGGRIHHPNVVAVHDCFAYRGDHYLVLEYVDGPDLREVIDRAAPVPIGVALSFGLELARGLRELHGRGVVHANLTPRRVLVSRWGEPKIRGLGLAHELGEEPPPQITPGPYTAPELVADEEGNACADVYSLGAILYELLTGEQPISPGTRPRGVPRGVARLIVRCLHRKPARRPSSGGELVRRLASLTNRPEPEQCRGAIVEWLYREGVLRPAQPLELEEPADPKERRDRSRFTTLAWGVGGAAVAVMALLGILQGIAPRGPATSIPVREPEAVAAVAAAPELPKPDPARIRFAVEPWAQVEVEGKAPFLTPRALPVELEPGDHLVIFRHPELGTVKRKIRVRAGEERVIQQVLPPENAS